LFLSTNVGYQLASREENIRLLDFPAGGGLHMTDLYLLALHEIGHALGLGDSTDPNAVMWGGPTGVTLTPIYMRRGLHADDIAGARFLFGPARPAAPIEPSVKGLRKPEY